MPSTVNTNSAAEVPKRKRPSPFRVKKGCVCALRQTDLNHISILIPNQNIHAPSEAIRKERVDFNDFIPVWTNPQPGRDEGLALIGKKVRCVLPKVAAAEGAKIRVVEGEIVGILDMKGFNTRPTKVELLIDRSVLEACPCLSRCDEDTDEAQLKSETARKHFLLEQKIRGPNKVTVKLRLASTVASASSGNRIIRNWAIRKFVPANMFHHTSTMGSTQRKKQPAEDLQGSFDSTAQGEPLGNGHNSLNNGTDQGLSATIKQNGAKSGGKQKQSSNEQARPKKRKSLGKTPSQLYLGDSLDSPEQQINNWRWLASRYHDIFLSFSSELFSTSSVLLFGPEVLSNGFIGEVVNLELSTDTSSSEYTKTIAMVTLRRLILPEQSRSGRLPHHGYFDIFDDADNIQQVDTSSYLLQVPVEQLVVVGRRLQRAIPDTSDSQPDDIGFERLLVSGSYSFRRDAFISQGVEGTSGVPCHRCRRTFAREDILSCTEEACPLATDASWCRSCVETLLSELDFATLDDNSPETPCCLGLCDCRSCTACRAVKTNSRFAKAVVKVQKRRLKKNLVDQNRMVETIAIAETIGEFNFDLPRIFTDLEATPTPSLKPVTKNLKRKLKSPPRGSNDEGLALKKMKSSRNTALSNVVAVNGHFVDSPDRAQLDPLSSESTCSRLLPYDLSGRGRKFASASRKLLSTDDGHGDRPRNLRPLLQNSTNDVDAQDNRNGRAARANQRRLLKGIAAIGGSSSLGVDTLANREPKLRFSRSGIHAWGVFADEDINSGELVVEYRGELIGNAVAEKREKQYNAAKIGSDYMFRIDGLTVCDATKQGNVARFLNASCDPNCFTKIITLDGTKRIVIYAKRDIAAGEELCYDYKFPIETDPLKLIRCYCGAKDCRGFMNGDPNETRAQPEREANIDHVPSSQKARVRSDLPRSASTSPVPLTSHVTCTNPEAPTPAANAPSRPFAVSATIPVSPRMTSKRPSEADVEMQQQGYDHSLRHPKPRTKFSDPKRIKEVRMSAIPKNAT